ncbi:hypothetical protein [Tumebacillus flagellatus]|uniref:Uncharacterized protein n=1 Tax=Tumebacillus flagellatus TaxID=1157490 RepID=A0A074LUV9_9BACL|nr:hypothetical protein [Tumebacillus flagellatus]KEO84410.1 hypothetical protein EL26_04730 [Tumebacillus flagellatus]
MSNNAKAPEKALAWSLLLFPAIGSIFWTLNWIGLDKQKHIWWTWVSALAVVIGFVFSGEWFGTFFVGFILCIGWSLLHYIVQRAMVSQKVRSVTAGIISVLLVILLLGTASMIARPNDGTWTRLGASVMVGTSYDKNSPFMLPVSGDDLKADKSLYVRVFSPAMFHSDYLDLVIQRQEGGTWKNVSTWRKPISPTSQVYVTPYSLFMTGTYKISCQVGEKTIADTIVRVQ